MENEYVVRRLNVGSVFKVSFVLYLLIGLVMALFYLFVILFFSGLGMSMLGPEMFRFFRLGAGPGLVLGLFGAAFFALSYAVFAAAITAAGAALYNVALRWTGGIRVVLAGGPPAPPLAPLAPAATPVVPAPPPGGPAPPPVAASPAPAGPPSPVPPHPPVTPAPPAATDRPATPAWDRYMPPSLRPEHPSPDESAPRPEAPSTEQSKKEPPGDSIEESDVGPKPPGA